MMEGGRECIYNSSCFLSDVAALLNDQSAAATAATAGGSSLSSSDGGDGGEGKAEGRFFLKDKLCALGLASVSNID